VKIEGIYNDLQRELEKLKLENDNLRKMFKSPKEKFLTINEETGDIYTPSELERESKAMSSLARQLRRKENCLLIEEEKTTINLNSKIHERRFVKLYYVSLRHLTEELETPTLGMLQKLIHYLRTDGTNGLIGETSKKYWVSVIGVSKNNFDKHFKILEDNNLVCFKRNRGIFLNPYYIRYGNEVERETLEMFNLTYRDGKVYISESQQNQ
jgi:DNA-binding transcriptional ArsR family regulator